jgi:hypothetical protein
MRKETLNPIEYKYISMNFCILDKSFHFFCPKKGGDCKYIAIA